MGIVGEAWGDNFPIVAGTFHRQKDIGDISSFVYILDMIFILHKMNLFNIAECHSLSSEDAQWLIAPTWLNKYNGNGITPQILG